MADSTTRCPQCHTQNPPGTKTCTFCNTPLPTPSRTPFKETRISSARDLTALSEGDLIAGRYRVKRHLDTGGMGSVYLAADEKLEQKEVALKVINPSLVESPEVRQRFVREVLASQELTHENIIKVFHLDEAEGVQFFTMEYLAGQSLREAMEDRSGQKQAFSLTEAAAVISRVLSALEHAHSHNVIHRDLKPENIVVSGDLPDARIKVLDFGLARIMSPSRLTSSAVAMGTAYYMAPEQLSGKGDVDERSDIFAAGVILYEMLTGRVPTGRFKLPSKLVQELPESVDDLVDTALQQDVEDRYSEAIQMRDALQQGLEDAPNNEAELAARSRAGNEAGHLQEGVGSQLSTAGQSKSYDTEKKLSDEEETTKDSGSENATFSSSSIRKSDSGLIGRIGLRGKMFFLFWVIPVFLISTPGYFSQIQINTLGSDIPYKTSMLTVEAGKEKLRQKARDVALQCELYLRAHPGMQREDFSFDPEFSQIAVQKVGETGYTCLIQEPEEDAGQVWTIWAHPDPNLVGIDDLDTLRKAIGPHFDEFFEILEASEGREVSTGHYMWKDYDGKLREKYMAIAPVEIEGKPFSVLSTAYMDEFTERTEGLRRDAEQMTTDTRNINLGILGGAIVIIGLCIIIYAYRVIRKIRYLVEAADRIGEGSQEAEIPVHSKDEIGSLADAISRIQHNQVIPLEDLTMHQ